MTVIKMELVIDVMPSKCEICSKEFNPYKEGGLIYFKETEKGKGHLKEEQRQKK